MTRPTGVHYADPNVALVASLIGDRVRAAMLFALVDGQELPASELAFRAGASPQAASAHLAKLVAAGLLVANASGRQRLFRVASPDIAHALESLAVIAPPERIVTLGQSTTMSRLREARSCYDHLAGRIGVAFTDYLVEHGALTVTDDSFEVTPSGQHFLAALEIDVEAARSRRRAFALSCTDWTERRPHLAGSLGTSILERFLSVGWVERNKQDRALRVTAEGRRELERFNIHF